MPLFELYDNVQRYGPIISAIPQMLSRFKLNFAGGAAEVPWPVSEPNGHTQRQPYEQGDEIQAPALPSTQSQSEAMIDPQLAPLEQGVPVEMPPTDAVGPPQVTVVQQGSIGPEGLMMAP